MHKEKRGEIEGGIVVRILFPFISLHSPKGQLMGQKCSSQCTTPMKTFFSFSSPFILRLHESLEMKQYPKILGIWMCIFGCLWLGLNKSKAEGWVMIFPLPFSFRADSLFFVFHKKLKSIFSKINKFP